ncbi:ORM1-like protein 3 [Trichoplax sp. H2]|uniref:ORM1-like protein 3 n=1 Tax=Trichoplax adhaerens TaxID=10228 RepID=B3RQQ9_TRIAD|nr:hypothetical protein TRIADDRAFT_23050 [Trichoplax adhaerens]EDV27285.1 hypothetical protein TRIADDRAFT_23050 [Trichoplax adhaerens]RDD36919.1 ORM1-like protein 3 [Trichoplax sp. H2]|eukprot:XP_002111281.1 hypothetical protein TRIADDRAFT_23050 [Trichoplax adhaerens]
MEAARTRSASNPNVEWLNSRGIWITYVLFILLEHFFFLSIPVLTVPQAWTLTFTFHNVFTFFLFHVMKGTPFDTFDQGKSRQLTHWEQIDSGEQFTRTRKFLIMVPIAMFMLTSFYTRYEVQHFLFNATTLCSVIIPKLPALHTVRIFGINKYNNLMD